MGLLIHCPQCNALLPEEARFCSACGAVVTARASERDPLVGRTIADAYVVLELVGVGGMGRVYRAEQRVLGRTVAIKVIHPHLLSDEQSVARFYTEARAASRLNHPNSVSIIDFGRTDDGVLYLVMEFLQGRDLAELLREDGPLPIVRVCNLVVGVLAALDEAHALGLIHRDLKPENVIVEKMRSGGDLVKVVDFGLAKILGSGAQDTSITLPGLVCGTPDYMSPEQGRGEPMDGRSDVYSMGVLLFELLTEDLPFPADSPTNVVLRHIQDPVPDPRERAPERNIPEELAAVVIKALAKKPADRFASAEQMAAALRAVVQQLGQSAQEVLCAECGAPSPANKRFCGECGAPLRDPQPSAARPSLAPRLSLSPPAAFPADAPHDLLLHEAELATLLRASERAAGGLVCAALVGEPGVGKTHLLDAFAEASVARGALVVAVSPHPSGIAVPYAPILGVVRTLLDVDSAQLGALAEDLASTQALVAAGLQELVEPIGLRGAGGGSRAGAVAAALAFAVGEGLQRIEATQAVVLVDDLHRSDGLSAQVLAALPGHAASLPLLVVVSVAGTAQVALPVGTEIVTLRGLTMVEAEGYLQGRRVTDEPGPDERLLLPLYLDQLRHLGHARDLARTLPPRLADSVAQRLQRLDASARRALQAACVLGDRCARASLTRIVGEADREGIDRLVGVGLLAVREARDELEVAHPFVRDLVEASTPAEARKTLHARALELAAEENAPIEVRAHHAWAAGEPLSALVLLERMGDLATERGDPDAAVLAYRRALELVRRELLESGDTSFEDALVTFSRRLGAALARRGDLTGAEGVLREALEFAGHSTLQRSLVLLELGRVVGQRKRTRDAYRLLGEALELSLQAEDLAAEAFAHVAVGELRRAAENHEGAIEAYRSALDLLEQAKVDPVWCARVAFDLAEETVAGSGDEGEVSEALGRARRAAGEARATYLEARLDALEATLARARGDEERVRRCLESSVQRAAQAGDAVAVARAAG